MSKGGGGGGTSTTVQKADPWPGLQPYLSKLYSGAGAQFDSGGPSYYPGNTVAPSNWNLDHALDLGYNVASNNVNATNSAISGLQSSATQGGSTRGQGVLDWFGQGNLNGNNPANSYLNEEASGTYLTDKTNPYLSGLYTAATDPMVSQFQKAIAPGIASQFSMAGRTGSGSHTTAFDNASDTLGRNLSDTATKIYGGAYENERQRQQQAIGLLSQNANTERGMQLQGAQSLAGAEQASQGLKQSAYSMLPQLLQSQYGNLDKMLGIGEYQRGQAQTDLNADMTRYNFNQNRPVMNLQLLNQLLQGGSSYAGSTGTTNSSQSRNPFASAVGGASVASGLGGAMGGDLGGILGGPWGLLGGALLGGLFG